MEGQKKQELSEDNFLSVLREEGFEEIEDVNDDDLTSVAVHTQDAVIRKQVMQYDIDSGFNVTPDQLF